MNEPLQIARVRTELHECLNRQKKIKKPFIIAPWLNVCDVVMDFVQYIHIQVRILHSNGREGVGGE